MSNPDLKAARELLMLARSILPLGKFSSGVWRDVRTLEGHIADFMEKTEAAAMAATVPAAELDPAPASSLPDWDECQMRVANSDFIAQRVAEGGYGADHDTKLATELHRFIYEYDDADPHRSAWFLHRLEKLLAETKAQAPVADQPAEPSPVDPRMVSVVQEDANRFCEILTLLGMEDEGDPVAEVQRLQDRAAHAIWSIWESLPGYLIDHCEGEIVSEEMLQRALEAMLKDPKYAAPKGDSNG